MAGGRARRAGGARVQPRQQPLAGSGARPAPDDRLQLLEHVALLRRGVLGQSFVISAAHTDDDLEQTVDAVRGALPVYGAAIEAGTVAGFLHGRPVAPALRTYAAPRRRFPDVEVGA